MKDKYGTTIDLNYSISKEQTHTFKLYVRLNDIQKENGIIKFFINDGELYNNSNWLFRTDTEVHIKSVWLDAYIGGGTPSKYDTFVLLDDLRIKW